MSRRLGIPVFVFLEVNMPFFVQLLWEARYMVSKRTFSNMYEKASLKDLYDLFILQKGPKHQQFLGFLRAPGFYSLHIPIGKTGYIRLVDSGGFLKRVVKHVKTKTIFASGGAAAWPSGALLPFFLRWRQERTQELLHGPTAEPAILLI